MRVKIQTILNLKRILKKGELELTIPRESTVEKLLKSMIKTWGDELETQLFRPKSSSLLPYLILLVNGRDVRFLNNMETVLQDGDEIMIVPPIAGG